MNPPRVRSLLIPLAAVLAIVAVVGVATWAARRSGDEPRSATSGLTAGPTTAGPAPSPTGTFRIDSYYLPDDTHLVLNYTTGVPACYGKVGVPRLVAAGGAVEVTLPRLGPARHKGVSCIDVVQVRSVTVTLEEPLGERVVRDGSREGAAVPPGTAPGGDQAK